MHQLGVGCVPIRPSRMRMVLPPELSQHRTHFDRTVYQSFNPYRSQYPYGLEPMQTAADGATALRTIGSSTEDAGLNSSLQIGGVIGRHFGEQALVWRSWRDFHGVGNAGVHEQF